MNHEAKTKSQLLHEVETLRQHSAEFDVIAAAHQQAAHTLRLQANLLDAVEQAIIVTDLDGTITYWNRYAERLYGWLASEVVDRNILDITPAAAT